jgi:AAA15 family ATPase/GTPase
VRKMLIQFNFENYKTYLKQTSLDFTATNINELKSNIIEYKDKEKYLKVNAIYGANASGKSNILEAFQLMRHWVLKSFEHSGKENLIPLKRFNFSNEGKNGKSTFETFFTINDKEFQYGFQSDEKLIYQEWLYKRNFKYKSKYDVVFEREKSEFNLRGDLKNIKQLLNSINQKTLLLSILSRLNIEDVIDVMGWFESTDVVNFGDVTFEYLISKTLPQVDFNNEREKKDFINYLMAIDIGIEDIRIEKIGKSNSMDTFESKKYKIYTKHRNLDSNDYEEIPLEEESSGTIKMISLYYFLNYTLKNGKTLFVDEMDAKLHPLLTRYIINLFHNEETNTKNAQLIFTTHDTNSLSKEFLRRDQIWFAEKDNKGVSTLFSLAEYKINNNKVRNDATYNKDYLGGRYGAVPNLKEYKVGE